jgi:hypothetical protein
MIVERIIDKRLAFESGGDWTRIAKSRRAVGDWVAIVSAISSGDNQ